MTFNRFIDFLIGKNLSKNTPHYFSVPPQCFSVATSVLISSAIVPSVATSLLLSTTSVATSVLLSSTSVPSVTTSVLLNSTSVSLVATSVLHSSTSVPSVTTSVLLSSTSDLRSTSVLFWNPSSF